ncbi:MAG: glycine/sarcosine/betaine reductase complex component C subunit beta [Defluviitaleaceae bacterium]|nr:glycine/sarcosine/betaine reductase complex component C subunit beta [Defluviitaleaceae bacterium]
MNAVVKATSYCLVHTPDMVLHDGTTQTTERLVNPNSEYLQKVPSHLRSFEAAMAYAPNQTYIGAMTPAQLGEIPAPWYDKTVEGASRYGKFGEIMPQEEFYLLMQACDAFDLMQLHQNFVGETKPAFEAHPLMDESILSKVKEGIDSDALQSLVADGAEGLYHQGNLVGCVKKAHDVDENLSAHVILENLVSKASCVLSLLHLTSIAGGKNIAKGDIDLVIDCSEEAVGDMNQRGGGNLAKAAAEMAGYAGATGADVRAFCAAPVHALIHAAALVKSGTYKNVIVAAGGSTAKLGMNGKDHVKKDLPILEDVVGAFAVLVSENDGVSPEFLSEYTGWHTVGSGSSPQAVITALVTDPLDKMGLKIPDIDKYSVEMHNPDVTKPAGAGDVPLANYKMIGALAVTKGQMERTALNDFIVKHGMVGWAPTQGHIPSGVPYMGFAHDDILSGAIKNCMVIGKGSLFLGRMTNLFDGCSFVLRKNPGKEAAAPVTAASAQPKIGIFGLGSEHGEANMMAGALAAAKQNMDVTYIGTQTNSAFNHIAADCEADAIAAMEAALESGALDAAVAMHYPFPIGVSTVGRCVTPAMGKAMYIATTTGTAHTDRVAGMVKNAIYGVIAAKACGVENPTVGLLNIDGARQAERALKELSDKGYKINFATSGRADGSAIMRGNDVLTAPCDIMVCDPLTGNILTKMLSSFSSGGSYESVGFGYGPGIGEGAKNLVLIVSRASGAPVVTAAAQYAAELVKGDWRKVMLAEFAAAKRAGLEEVLNKITAKTAAPAVETASFVAPAKEIVTAEISGIEIMDLDSAVEILMKNGIYAESGMGCTGPIVLVNEAKYTKAADILMQAGLVGV